MEEVIKDRWIVTSVEALASALGFIEERTLRKKCQHPSFPKTATGPDTFEYEVLEAQKWFDANRGAFTRDVLKTYRQPEFQTDVMLQGKKGTTKEIEQTRFIHHQANIAAIKERKELGELCETAKRDADDIEKYSVLKHLLYQQARVEVPILLTKTTPQEMEEATKALIDTALKAAQDAWRHANAEWEADEKAAQAADDVMPEQPLEDLEKQMDIDASKS